MAYLCREGEEQPAARKAQEKREVLVNDSGIVANACMKKWAGSNYANNVHVQYMLKKNRQPFCFLKLQ